jgi:N-acetylmuramoyl-L-alanine amidase
MLGTNKKSFTIILASLLATLFALVTPVETSAMQAKKIVVDAGHGGIDSGCIVKGMHEKDITLDISREVKKLLERKGYDVMLTRNSDESLYKYCRIGDTIQRRDLNARVNMINNSGASAFVSIHANSFRSDPSINGSIAFFFSHECLEAKALARSIQKSLNSLEFNGKKRRSHNSRAEDYYILRKTALPGVLVETGFLTSSMERKWFATKEYKRKIAKSIVAGIDQYMKNKSVLD